MTIGIPSFFLALQPNTERVRGRFLRNVVRQAVPGAAAVTLCAAVAMHLEHIGLPEDICSTLAAASAGAVGLLVLLTHCLPFNRLRAALFALMTVLFVGAMILLPDVFYLVRLNGRELAFLVGLIAAGATVLFGLRAWMKRRQTRELPGT